MKGRVNMALREIVTVGDEVLRKVCREVTVIDDRTRQLLDDMADTMYFEHRGVGLAAPQVGMVKRIFICDVGDGTGLHEFINPVISDMKGSVLSNEGCLSVPGKSGDVERPEELTIKALDRHGNPFELHAAGFLAICICHENDHLNGILFIDKVKGDVVSN